MSDFDWIEFINYGRSIQILSIEEQTEVVCRAGVSRIYYGTFHRARLKVEQHTYPPSPLDGKKYLTHTQVYRFLQDNDSTRIGDYLKQLYDLRSMADYIEIEKIGINHLNTALGYSAKILQRLEQLNQAPWN